MTATAATAAGSESSDGRGFGRREFCLALAATASIAAAPALLARDSKTKGGKGKSDDAIVFGTAGAEMDRHLCDAALFPEGFNGVALVARDGKILLEKGYGVADAAANAPLRRDALFDWCSVSKHFTAAAVLRLEMQKKLDVDAPLSKVLKDVPKDKSKITLRHLMNHTSGLAGKPPRPFSRAESEDRESLIRWVLEDGIAAPPGEHWEYSNAGYFLLAAIVERVSGKRFEDHCREQLFKPAGLSETFLIGEPKLPLDRVPLDKRGTGDKFAYGTELTWGYRGAGGVVASVADMLRWDRALRGKKVLSDAAKKKYYEVGKSDYALGWEVKKQGALSYEHSGRTGDVVTFYMRWMDPDVVVALAHNEEPKTHPERTAYALAALARNA
jgi:CubicO group peptidase (beta-lactamase class C family)